MLHNIMKQNRSNFNRIPIIRKLLKVLEFLALRGILSPEQINRDPPCNGMESFKESILSLTRHSDVQVHQIARNFRDKWIPRTFKRVEQSDRDGSRLDPQHSCRSWFQSSSKVKCWTEQGARETASIVTSTATHLPASSAEREIPGQPPSSHGQRVPNSAHVTDKSSACGTGIRKRKSRWGPPLDTSSLHPQSLCSVENIVVDGVKCRKLSSAQQEKTCQHEGSNQTSSSSWDEIVSVSNLMHKNANVESPPGFGSLPQNASVETTPGFGSPQENGSGETPPRFGCPQQNASGETPPGFGYPQQNASVEAPPGFGFSQQNASVEAPPGFEFPQQNASVEAPPGFEFPQQNASVEAPPGFEFPQQNASVEAPPGFRFPQQNASGETPPGFVSPQQNASVEAPPGFGYLEKNANFEAPPGFESRQEEHSSQMSSEIPVAPGEVVMGHLQERYLSHLTVSFGIPVSLMQLGTLETGGRHSNPSWSVAPSMPFHPFPPLPSYPRPTPERGQTHVSSGTEKTSTSEGPGRISESCYSKSQIHGRMSWPSNGPARRFPGQQRRNDGRFPRCLPYPNQRIGQGAKGSMRDGTSNLDWKNK
ncbi:histone-lysine N-methyltransferase ASHH2 isoform X1 [Iris pallida]|uniref:Histone-lysine N-methyltransferase ASHH2 isoform X1 n=1 Tax=Iris pallida TaxID=29817 RepID=A0AAX6E4I6_IRIPA|nr:histone-lysine N-methyltransferase ASHH2 isoform X1 [Iris pallida]